MLKKKHYFRDLQGTLRSRWVLQPPDPCTWPAPVGAGRLTWAATLRPWLWLGL